MKRKLPGFESAPPFTSSKLSGPYDSTGAEPAAPRRMYIPSPPRHRRIEGDDTDLENIAYIKDEAPEEQLSPPQSDVDDNGADDSQDGQDGNGDDEVDPLDAFMAGIHKEVKESSNAPKPNPKANRDEWDEEDPMESFIKARKNAGLSLAASVLHAGYDSDEEVYAAAKAVDAGTVEYDSDDNPIVSFDKKKVESLPPLDHSEIEYEEFNKDFYPECPEIASMLAQDVAEYRQGLGIRVSGYDVVKPIKSFDQAGLDAATLGVIAKQGYEKPTPIQCQGIPVALSGRDIIGIAKTGSGKTAAFVLPMVVHILDQRKLAKGEGPIGIVCAPTRELAQQIYTEAKKFAKPHGIRVSGVFGGMSKFEQFKELKAGTEIVVATPGRLIDMIKMKAMSMVRATFLVLDEADRMFDMGFEPQMRSITGQIRPDRQTLLFSATMQKRVERLAREVLSDPVRVIVGEIGEANEDITQKVSVLPSDNEKLPWLLDRLPALVDEGDVLVFASMKVRVEEVEVQLREKGFKVAALHGDKDQATRLEVLRDFKAGLYHVLVATDVAARGLDIKTIKTVVNIDIAKDIDGHVHRIGRTGRAGAKDGVAYTLVTQREARFAGDLVNNLTGAGQVVPDELIELAMKDGRFRAQQEGRQTRGLGKARAGLGAGKSSDGKHRGRGFDYGMGIGFDPRSAGPQPKGGKNAGGGSRESAVASLRVGMTQRFRSSFVAASPEEPSAPAPSSAAPALSPPEAGRAPGGGSGNALESHDEGPSPYSTGRRGMGGFTSGGVIGGFGSEGGVVASQGQTGRGYGTSYSSVSSVMSGFASGGTIGSFASGPGELHPNASTVGDSGGGGCMGTGSTQVNGREYASAGRGTSEGPWGGSMVSVNPMSTREHPWQSAQPEEARGGSGSLQNDDAQKRGQEDRDREGQEDSRWRKADRDRDRDRERDRDRDRDRERERERDSSSRDSYRHRDRGYGDQDRGCDQDRGREREQRGSWSQSSFEDQQSRGDSHRDRSRDRRRKSGWDR